MGAGGGAGATVVPSMVSAREGLGAVGTSVGAVPASSEPSLGPPSEPSAASAVVNVEH